MTNQEIGDLVYVATAVLLIIGGSYLYLAVVYFPERKRKKKRALKAARKNGF